MNKSTHPIFLTQSHPIKSLLARATLGMTLASAFSMTIGCNSSDMDSEFSESRHSGHQAPYYDVSAAGGEYLDESEMNTGDDPSQAIVDQAEVQYNAEEDASLDNQLTFAVDVDTASYTIARTYLQNGQLPPKEVIRVEEFINFFDYQDAAPEDLEASPFAVHLDAAKSPFGSDKTLLRVGLKGFEVANEDRPPTNLVFLIDTSGSMGSSIDLVKDSLGLLLDNLNMSDTIAIVTYAGNSQIALTPTSVSQRDDILNAMGRLQAGGSTNGADGIITAYELAQNAFKDGGLNRVVLCTDGDFNVGVTGEGLYELIEEKREGGITLSVLGFGGRYNDTQMEQLADRGNGNYTFIDSLREAQRALVDRLTATLMVIAKDVKVQLEVNPTIVKTYRLLGYENRAIADEDFRNDSVDAGEIGAGHGVTALVELELFEAEDRPTLEEIGATIYDSSSTETEIDTNTESDPEAEADPEADPETEIDTNAEADPETDPEDIQGIVVDAAFATENAPLALLRLRHKTPDATAEDTALEQVQVISEEDIRNDAKQASKQLIFSAAVAEFAEILRESPYVAEADFDAIIELAEEGKVAGDEWMEEFIELVQIAKGLYRQE